MSENNLGVMYRDGRGVEQNDAAAVGWFRKAAGKGNAWAEFNLGRMYRLGRGVIRDDAAALEWFRKAAAHGHADAREALRELGDSSGGDP